MGKYTLDFTASEINERLSKLDNTPISMELVWENASISSAFNKQTLSLDLSEYSYVLIQSCYDSYGNMMANTLISVGSNSCLNFGRAYNSGFIVCSRDANARVDGIYFGDNEHYQNGYTITNTRNIPRYVYGIKGVQ